MVAVKLNHKAEVGIQVVLCDFHAPSFDGIEDLLHVFVGAFHVVLNFAIPL